MDKDSQEVLQRILEKDRSELTKYDIDFLKARRSYLSKADKREYADVLGEEDQAPQQPQQPKKQKQNNNANQDQQPQQPKNDEADSEEENTGGGGDEDAGSDCLDPDCSNPEHNHEE